MKLIQGLRQFGGDRKGIAAIEFAIIAPLLMVPLLLGSVDLIDALSANKRAQNAASSLADVVARDTAVSDAEVEGLWAALDVLMFPDNGASMQLRITSVRVVSATSATVVWSEGHGMTALTPGSPVTGLATGMMQAGTSIIMAESVYPYDAPLGFLYAGQINMRHEAYRRSRLVDPIPRVAVES